MNSYIVFAFAFICLVGINAKPAGDKYTTKFDSVDVDNVLKNERLLKGYANCLLGKGNCSPDGTELKSVLPDALKTECSKCSEKQKVNSRKVLVTLIEKQPEIYADLEKVYDPTGDYKKKYCELAKKEETTVKACAA